MDDRVASAISHWGPRFTTNGVTVADFERVTRSVEKWSQWCASQYDGGRSQPGHTQPPSRTASASRCAAEYMRASRPRSNGLPSGSTMTSMNPFAHAFRSITEPGRAQPPSMSCPTARRRGARGSARCR